MKKNNVRDDIETRAEALGSTINGEVSEGGDDDGTCCREPVCRATEFSCASCSVWKRGLSAAFRVGHRDAKVLTPEFGGAITEDLLELGIGRSMVRIGTDWTLVHTAPPPARPEKNAASRIVETTRKRFRKKHNASKIDSGEKPPQEGKPACEFVQ